MPEQSHHDVLRALI